MSATTSPAIARLEYGAWSGVVGGFEERPYPRRSGHTTVCPASASSGATRCQVVWVRGCPCRRTTGGPSPPERTRSSTPSAPSTRCSTKPSKNPLVTLPVRLRTLARQVNPGPSGFDHGRRRLVRRAPSPAVGGVRQEQRFWNGPAGTFQPSRYRDQCARSSLVIARLASVS